MYKIDELSTLMKYAADGNMPPVGDVSQSDEVLGFAYGLYFDEQGQLASPGPVNEAIADLVVGDEVLRSKNMTLQEELAVAIKKKEPKLADQIDTLRTIKKPGVAFNTHELLTTAKPGLVVGLAHLLL